MWWIYALLSALFAALTTILAKAGMKNIQADLATAIRTTVVVLLAWGIVLVKGMQKSAGSLTRPHLLFLVLSGIGTGLSWIFYFRAVEIGEVSKVASVDKLSLAFVILFSVLFLGESLTLKTGIGALLIISGALLISMK